MFLMNESRKDFISRMIWLVSEIKASDKGSELDALRLLDFHLGIREGDLNKKFLAELQMHIYENVDGNKQKLLNQTLEIYANQKK